MLKAKELYESLVLTRATSASAPYEKALKQLFQHKFTTSADTYCNTFLRLLQGVSHGASAMANTDNTGITMEDHKVPKGIVAAMFVFGTEGIQWLDMWRSTKVRRQNGTLMI